MGWGATLQGPRGARTYHRKSVVGGTARV